MTARQSIQHKLMQFSQQRRDKGAAVAISTAAVETTMRAGAQMLLAAVAAGATLCGDRAPFGTALVGASGPGVYGGAALIGACFGYLSQLEFSNALRYTAASILTFAVAFAFYDLKYFHRAWIMPVVTAGLTAFTGIVTYSRMTWTAADCTAFLVEVVLTAFGVWGYQAALMREKRLESRSHTVHRAGMLMVLITVLIAMEPLRIGSYSFGCSAAALAVLLLAAQGGLSMGAAVGLVLGIGMDLAQGEGAMYAMVWGASGILAGALKERGRLPVAAGFALMGGISVLWASSLDRVMTVCLESAVAGVLFLWLPQHWLRQLRAWLACEERGVGEKGQVERIRIRLGATSKAFHTLYEALYTAFSPPENDNDVASVFDRTAGRVCRRCSLWNLCWQKEYNTTFNALNDATPAMVQRGKAESRDFPLHFTSRCAKWSEFLEVVNEELTALFYRRQYNARIRENRTAVCRQYDQLSELLEQAASDLSRDFTPDLEQARLVRQKLAEYGINARIGVFRDHRGMLHLEAEGEGCGALERGVRVQELSQLLGVPLRVEHTSEGNLSLVQQEPLMAVAGVAAQKKSGETVSGDAGTYFKCPDGILYVLLCDGMGSGPEANRESSLAVRLLEQFLQAGVKAERALVTLASALALRGEETGGFTTVDLLSVDLFSGDGVLYKLGAAPTYLKQGDSVKRYAGTSLPAGLAEGKAQAVDRFPLHLEPGDCVLMVSDGICGTGEDQWIFEQLAAFDSSSPKDLARELLTKSPQGATDDRTALAIRIEKREVYLHITP